MFQKFFVFQFLFLFITSNLTYAGISAAEKAHLVSGLKNGGALVVDGMGNSLLSHRENDSFIPASTIKVATAASALKIFGNTHRFTTEFYKTEDGFLGIKGYGDPFLVSEEIALIAKEIKRSGENFFKGILIDTSYFSSGIVIDGASTSSNPYDAITGALVVNFNTISVVKQKNGQIISGEPQTPLTPLAISEAKKLGRGKHRVNLGNSRLRCIQYAGELISAFLRKEGIEVLGPIKSGIIPENAGFLVLHKSSRTLEESVREFLGYSTNFMANQIFLAVGAKVHGAPATIEKGQMVLNEFLRNDVGWKNFRVVEGAGLSHLNRVTPKDMMALLQYFEPNKNLLPLKEHLFLAKTGTLRGVNTFMGFFKSRDGKWIKFVLLINSPVSFDHKFKLAKELYRAL